MVLLASVLAASAILALSIYSSGQRMSPDGRIYLQAAAGESVPRPFHLRPLLPIICGTRLWAWRIASVWGLVMAAVAIGSLAVLKGASAMQAIAASALFAALPMSRTTAMLPVLVDGPALGFAAVSAVCVARGDIGFAIWAACFGALFKEHVPVFAALAGWSAWPLLGLLVTVGIWWFRTPAPPSHPSQMTPFRYARVKQAPRILDATKMLLPWGACLAAALSPGLPLVASLAAGYALLFVSADSTRIYQWGAIPVCVAAALVIPEAWLPLAIIAHVLNPWQGEL